MFPDAYLLDKIAAVAHELWCSVMEAQGWRPGPRFDRVHKVHDALRPYAELDRHDQRQARVCMEAEELYRVLPSALHYQRGPDRELLIEEMREGLRVAFSECPMFGEEPPRPPSQAALQGQIIGWETDEEGELALVRVKWDDGSVAEYHPSSRELCRIEE